MNISVSKTYNSSTRQLNATISSTALQNLTGDYFINYVIYENNLICYQAGEGECIGGQNYVHNYVVRSMINGALGEFLNSNSIWNQNQQIVKNMNLTLDSSWIASNCFFAVFVYLSEGNLSSNSFVQQTFKEAVIPIGIKNESNTISEFTLTQNYPNPFNPTTNINFSLPKGTKLYLSVYDILGNEISILVDGFLNRGIYHIIFDGSHISSGVYFYRLITNEFIETKKMILLR